MPNLTVFLPKMTTKQMKNQTLKFSMTAFLCFACIAVADVRAAEIKITNISIRGTKTYTATVTHEKKRSTASVTLQRIAEKKYSIQALGVESLPDGWQWVTKFLDDQKGDTVAYLEFHDDRRELKPVFIVAVRRDGTVRELTKAEVDEIYKNLPALEKLFPELFDDCGR